MTMYSFVTLFHEVKFCSVPSYVFEKLWYTAGEKKLQNTVLDCDLEYMGLCQEDL